MSLYNLIAATGTVRAFISSNAIALLPNRQ
jgi:hypothetical protein